MKTLLAAGFAIAAFLSAPQAALADEAGDLAAIRDLYARIDQAKAVKTETIKFEMESGPMDGTMTRRSYEGGLAAVQLSYSAGDHGGTDENYYFSDGKLFFILIKDSSWQFAPGSTDDKPKTTDTLTESRYYVSKGAIVQLLRRSVSGESGKKLEELLAKAENKKVTEDDLGRIYLKRAAVLLTLKTKEDVEKMFASEES